MSSIGGNKVGMFQIKGTSENEIGEQVVSWNDVQSIEGWLDYQSGDSSYTYNTKIQESTHVFVADYYPLDKSIREENSRMIIDGGRYEVKCIDNPMGLNRQLEIYLKYTGGQ